MGIQRFKAIRLLGLGDGQWTGNWGIVGLHGLELSVSRRVT